MIVSPHGTRDIVHGADATYSFHVDGAFYSRAAVAAKVVGVFLRCRASIERDRSWVSPNDACRWQRSAQQLAEHLDDNSLDSLDFTDDNDDRSGTPRTVFVRSPSPRWGKLSRTCFVLEVNGSTSFRFVLVYKTTQMKEIPWRDHFIVGMRHRISWGYHYHDHRMALTFLHFWFSWPIAPEAVCHRYDKNRKIKNKTVPEEVDLLS